MRAIVLDDGVRFDASRPAPAARDGEVLVRVTTAGVCETDLQLIKGYMGFRGVLGHEFVGVAESGPYAGRRVVGEINCACWTCDMCGRGLPTHCRNRTVLGILNHDGAFADLIAVPQRNLHLVPDSLPDEVAVFTEPVAAAFQVPAQIPVGADDRIVVLGDGRLGNLCAQVLAARSSRVLVVGKHPEKLALLQAMGIETALLGAHSGPEGPPPRSGEGPARRSGEGPPPRSGDDAVWSGDLPEHGADIVVDCTGSETGLPTALRLVRPRGTIVLKTTVAGTQTLAWAPFVIDEVTLVGSRCGPFDQALAALEEGRVDVRPLISGRVNLSDGAVALDRAQAKGVLKVLIEVG
jgi:threonine dehydrogenase-like Zn-dependent dehydrogenase